MSKRISQKELLKDIHRVSEEVNGKVGREDYDRFGRYSSTTVHNRFGSWTVAVIAAGLKPIGGGIDNDGNLKRQQISNDDLKEDIRNIAKELGRAPTCREYTEMGDYARPTVNRRFGSWNEAVEEVGLEPKNGSRCLTPPRDDLLKAYYGERKDTTEIGEEYDVSYHTVTDWLDFYNIPIVRSARCRRVMWEGIVSIEESENISNSSQRNHGIVEEDGEYVFKPEFSINEEIREMYANDDVPEELEPV